MTAHIVLYRAKPGTGPSDVRSLALAIDAACRGIPSVSRAIVGRITKQSSVGDLSVGDTTYDAAAVLEFADQAGLQEYLEHPIHIELSRLFWLHCQSTLVVDADMGDAATAPVAALLGLET